MVATAEVVVARAAEGVGMLGGELGLVRAEEGVEVVKVATMALGKAAAEEVVEVA